MDPSQGQRLHDLGGSPEATADERRREAETGGAEKVFFGATQSPRRMSTGNARYAGRPGDLHPTEKMWQRRQQPEQGTLGSSNDDEDIEDYYYSSYRGQSYEGGEMGLNEDDTDEGLLPRSDSNASTSWNEEGDLDNEDEDAGSSRGRTIRRNRDRRKSVDLTTPTLIDEEDIYEDEEEEQEMIRFERERVRKAAGLPPTQSFFGYEDDLRRTPGASMYRPSFEQESMRRTPGASKMHASAVSIGSSSCVQQDAPPAPDSSGLGFGLTLSTPIASTTSDDIDGGTSASWGPRLSYPSGSISDEQEVEKRELMNRSLISGGSKDRVVTDSRGAFVSPWTIVKGHQQQQQQPQSESGRGVYSPNTLRLTEDIGNLLLEDDDASDETQKISQFVFRSSATSSKAADDDSSLPESRKESWTAPYEVSMEAPSRVPRTYTGRGRRGRLDGSRRARVGVERTTPMPSSLSAASSQAFSQRPGGSFFLPNATAQPTPLRNFHPQPFVGHFGGSSSGTHPGGMSEFAAVVDGVAFPERAYESHVPQDLGSSSNRLFNLGGAFSPPAKGVSSVPAPALQRQLPPAHSAMHYSNQGLFGRSNTGFDGADHLPPFPTGTPAFGASFSNQQTLPQFQTIPSFGSHPSFRDQSTGPPSHPPHFGGPPSQNLVFGGGSQPPPPVGSRQSPTFTFQPQSMAYTMHPLPNLHQHQNYPPDFMANMSVPHPHPLPPPPQFTASTQPWQHSIQYDGMSTPAGDAYGHTVHGSHGGWHMGEYQSYHQQEQHHHLPAPPMSGYNISPVPMPTPSPVWTSDGEISQLLEKQSNPFLVPPSTQQTCIPVASTGRPPSRGKSQRKGANKKWVNWAPQHQIQKKSALRVDATPSPATTITGAAAVKKPVVSSKVNKKKQAPQAKDRATPPLHGSDRPSSAVSEDIPERIAVIASASDDPADTKRAELSESPATRSAFKDFYRKLRAEERESFQDAHEYAMQTLSAGSLPETVHWRVYLELADLAKRSNRFEEARKLYQQVCSLQPYASQGWLEFSKLEEECGNMAISAKILHAGLEYCEYSENLLTRAIKHEEKMGNLSRARELLSRLKHIGIEKVWRTVLEGALLEARAGNDLMARRVLKYLMHHVPWYGPLYLEAYRLEKDLGRSKEALAVVERGLTAIPRYGPLWFGAFRLCEEIDLHDHFYWLPQSTAMIDRATLSISKELIWKVHLEAAQMLERSATEYLDSRSDPTFLRVIESCRKRFSLTILSCPPNLRWKVWLAAGRMEVAAGNSDIARRLFLTAHRVVPDKGRAVALLECARLEEYVGDVELASAILCKSRNSGGSDWKVWLESVMLATRSGDFTKAILLSQKALQQNSGTGRLWASLIQLRHIAEAEKAQFESLTLALNAVPKSGEVWCEGARIHLNPFSRTFDPQRASRHLFFATKFTPQYGDGFLESLRLLIIDQLLLPVAALIWECTEDRFKEDASAEGLTEYVYGIIHELNVLHAVVSKEGPETTNPVVVDSFLGTAVIESILERLYSEQCHQFLDLTNLILRCANADPNYGPLWFHCRSAHTDTARKVLTQAVDVMLNEVKRHANLYIAGSVRRFAILSLVQQNQENKWKEGSRIWENLTDQECLSSPSLQQIIEVGNNKKETGVELLESSIPPSDFITGIVALSRHRPLEEMTSSEKRKVLFGADSLFS